MLSTDPAHVEHDGDHDHDVRHLRRGQVEKRHAQVVPRLGLNIHHGRAMLENLDHVITEALLLVCQQDRAERVVIFLLGVLELVDHDTNEQVHHKEAANDHKHDKEERVGGAHTLRPPVRRSRVLPCANVHALGHQVWPPFQARNLKEHEERVTNVVEIARRVDPLALLHRAVRVDVGPVAAILAEEPGGGRGVTIMVLVLPDVAALFEVEVGVIAGPLAVVEASPEERAAEDGEENEEAEPHEGNVQYLGQRLDKRVHHHLHTGVAVDHTERTQRANRA
mmetsp:Transcript_23812/g.64196  ORF Transcript_23812/g.64196 Transcript_23812/m.64196 type:complete len:280 (-) Transcript_23812:3812-4651(-)